MADTNAMAATALAQRTFEGTSGHPTLVIVHSHIGDGATHKQHSAAAHGGPPGVEEACGAKQFYAFDPDADFAVPDGVGEHFSVHFGLRGSGPHEVWQASLAAYRM